MGANPTLAELPALARLVQPPVVAIVLAENDRFAQGYSIVTSFDDISMTCEIVGPGFDASDLTRGQVSPHERIVFWRKHTLLQETGNLPQHLSLPDSGSFDYRELRPSDIVRAVLRGHTIVGQDAYEASRRQRYAKIYAIIQAGLGLAVMAQDIGEDEVGVVDQFLEAHHTRIPHVYRPIGCDMDKLQELYAYLADLDVFYSREVTGNTLSACFLQKHGLVFWDLYGSDKYYSKER
jgi:hypothetical protein